MEHPKKRGRKKGAISEIVHLRISEPALWEAFMSYIKENGMTKGGAVKSIVTRHLHEAGKYKVA
ncbi:MAG: hypothetical protein M0024_10500 [Nitrospiraceae bacterium]|nr:hypothetical protein [Nitrospiraceae bacterium]